MPSLVTDQGLIVSDFPQHVVEIKESLADPTWEEVSFLRCDRLRIVANAYDEAELSYELGDIMQAGTEAFNQFSPLGLLGWFVRITVAQVAPLENIVWVGVIVGTANQRSAVKTGAPDNTLTGKQQLLSAAGLEYFLDRVQIDSAYVGDTKIYRSIPFNGGRGVALDYDTRDRGNRSEDVNGDGFYTFTTTGNSGELWTLVDVVSYLLFYFTTQNTFESRVPIPFAVKVEDSISGVISGISPTCDPDGMTTFQVLNKLLAPQRGFVWWLEFDETNFIGLIRIETLSDVAITLPSLGTIPANRDQQTLDFDQERDVEDVIVAEFGSRIYHQIITRGARMTSTCTFGIPVFASDYDELFADWSGFIADEYNDGVTDGTDKENDAFRKEERFHRVYAAFRLSADWDFKSGDGSDAERNWTFPVLSDTGSVLDTLPVNIEGLRLLNVTRLKRGWDYQDVSDIEETTPTGTEAEYMPLFGIVQVATGSELTPEDEGYPGTGNDKYQYIDKMSKTEFKGHAEPVSGRIGTSYDIGAQQNVPGVLIRANGMNHAMALNHFSGETSHEPEVDYATLRVTCTIEADAYCESKWPVDEDLPENVPLQKLVLYVGDEYRLDFLAQNTVVRLDNGEPVLTNGGVLRDDRKHLQDIARVAYEWYQVQRFPLTVTFRQIRNLFRLGMLVTTIGSGSTQEQVNTVVSQITYNFVDGTMTVQTSDQDLDLVRVT